MSQYLVATLERDGDVTPTLWSRGGIEGVEVQMQGYTAILPRHLILQLIADEYRHKRVMEFVGMKDEEVVRRLGL